MDDLDALKAEISAILQEWFRGHPRTLPHRSDQIANQIVQAMKSGCLHITKRYIPHEREESDAQPDLLTGVRFEADIRRGAFGMYFGTVYRVDGEAREEISQVSSLFTSDVNSRDAIIRLATQKAREYIEPTTVVLDV